MSVARWHHAEFWEWRIAGKSIVGINIETLGMIDCQQFHLIEIHGFFHGLEKTETELAIARLQTFPGNFQIFGWIGNVSLSGRDPVANDAGTDHVGDEFVFVAIPGKQNGAGTTAAVKLSNALPLATIQPNPISPPPPTPTHPNDIPTLSPPSP